MVQGSGCRIDHRFLVFPVMKRILVAVLLCIAAFNSFAQADKIFNSALKQGVVSKGAYCAVNKQNKDVSVRQMWEYICQRGYIPGQYKKKEINRFGEVITVFDQYEFYSRDSYSEYVFSVVAPSGTAYSRLNGVGTCFWVETEKLYSQHFIFSILSGYDFHLRKMENIRWSGTVKDGYLDGKGVGFAALSDTEFICFEGEFKYGVPTKEFPLKKVVLKSLDNGIIKEDSISEERWLAPLSVLVAEYAKDDDPVIRKGVSLYIADQYVADSEIINSLYPKLLPVTVENASGYELDVNVPRFVQTYETAQYDPDHILPKATELLDVLCVVEALQLKIHDSYLKGDWRTIFTSVPTIDEAAVKGDTVIVNQALRAIDKRLYIDKSPTPFHQFFQQSEKPVREKNSLIYNRLYSNSVTIDLRYQAYQERERDRIERQSKEIDWENSTYPSGEVVSELLGGHHFSENGEIRFKEKHHVTYNASCNRDGTEISSYYILYCSNELNQYLKEKYFDTFDKMLIALIEAASH